MENNSEINQPSAENKSQIVINVPAKDEIVKSRWLSPTTYIIGFLFFFLTFCDVSCSNQQLASISGVNLVFGKDISNELMGDVETVPPNIWAIVAFLACIIGIFLNIKKFRFTNLFSLAVSVIGFLSLLILQITVKSSIDDYGEGTLRVGFKFAYWIVLITFIINSIVSYLKIKNEKEVNGALTYSLREFFQKKINVAILCGIVSVIIFFLFKGIFLNNPQTMGKSLIEKSIDCRITYCESLINGCNEFINKFNVSSYSKKQQARDEFDSITQMCIANKQHCDSLIDKIDKKNREKLKNNKEKILLYESTINKGNIDVASKYKDELDKLWNQIDEKIKLIKDPEPDSYKIKNDLLRKSIGSWTFVSLNEFKTFKIESTVKNPEKLSFLCKTDMIDLDNQMEYYAIFYVNYKLVNGEWRYSNLTEIFYDYKNSKNFNGDKLILEGNWQWPQNSAQYNNDGTWSGKWKDGKEKNGRFKIIQSKLTVYDETGSVFASGELKVINENELKLSNWSGTYIAKRLSN